MLHVKMYISCWCITIIFKRLLKYLTVVCLLVLQHNLLKCTIYRFKGQISAICIIGYDIPNGIAIYRWVGSRLLFIEC